LLDKYDQKIMALLQDDGRMSISQLAREVSLSRSAVTERLKRLEESHTISGYHARLGTLRQPPIRAYFELFYQVARCEQYAEQLRLLPEVQLCHSISGQTDMLVYVEVADMTRLESLRREIENLPNITMVKTHMVLSELINRKF
jgi:Lrp/AsnC family transcriptional regulator, leucine-responsive regulatory protein